MIIWFKAWLTVKVDPTSEAVQRLVLLGIEYPRMEIPLILTKYIISFNSQIPLPAGECDRGRG